MGVFDEQNYYCFHIPIGGCVIVGWFYKHLSIMMLFNEAMCKRCYDSFGKCRTRFLASSPFFSLS